MLQLFNSLTKTVEPFRPLKGRTVRVYTCGPTVYDFAHIGNLRSYLFADTLTRALILVGNHVRHVVNITDVGHLTGDVDEGEDKMERAATKQRKTAAQIAAFYTRAFLKDLKRLGIRTPDVMPRATAYIREQIALVRRLERLGYTYVTSDGVYFDTAKFPAYGKAFVKNFSPSAAAEGEREGEGASAHARIAANPEKRSPYDFALWKLTPPGVRRQQEWPSPWGKGFPGWHIECSVMSRCLLGQPFDIHTGGIDHIPVHHTNEIAQSEAAYGTPLARTWTHNAFLTVDGGRMGKSEGNLITLDAIIAKGIDPCAYRLFALGAHYRSSLNFTWEALTASQSALIHLRTICRTLPRRGDGTDADAATAIGAITAACNDDLNTPQALAALWDALRSSMPLGGKTAVVVAADRVLGLGLTTLIGKKVRIPPAVRALVAAREAARQAKDWARADVLRAQIGALGWSVEDTKMGAVAKPIGRSPG